MTDAAKRVLEAVAEVVRHRLLLGKQEETNESMGARQKAFRALWFAYDDYEREQPPTDHGYRQ